MLSLYKGWRLTLGGRSMQPAWGAAAMPPADHATEQPEAGFSVRRRQRGGRRIVQVSSSLSAMDALRARFRSQNQAVVEHIATDTEARAFIADWATPEPLDR
jgi:hypothetical protein